MLMTMKDERCQSDSLPLKRGTEKKESISGYN